MPVRTCSIVPERQMAARSYDESSRLTVLPVNTFQCFLIRIVVPSFWITLLCALRLGAAKTARARIVSGDHAVAIDIGVVAVGIADFGVTVFRHLLQKVSLWSVCSTTITTA